MKGILLLLIISCIFLQFINGASIENRKKITRKCFIPKKPDDMPDDVYKKFKESSKNLSEDEAKDFWGQFKKWFSRVLSKINEILQNISKAIQKAFGGKEDKKEEIVTEAPPMPSQSEKDANVIVECIEIIDEIPDDDNGNDISSGGHEVDYSSEATTMTTYDVIYTSTISSDERVFNGDMKKNEVNDNEPETDQRVNGEEKLRETEVREN